MHGPEETLIDNGFDVISAPDYIFFRLIPKLKEIRIRLPILERRANKLRACSFIGTAVSVLLSTLGIDIWVAFSTACITAFNATYEFQRLNERLIALNFAENWGAREYSYTQGCREHTVLNGIESPVPI